MSPQTPVTPENIEGDTVLGEKSDEMDAAPEDLGTAGEAAPRCPPPRWATGLRRVLYPDVTIDEREGEASSGS
jgi:hypothetical protein